MIETNEVPIKFSPNLITDFLIGINTGGIAINRFSINGLLARAQQTFQIPCSDRVTPIPVANNIMSWPVPFDLTVSSVQAYLTNPAVTGIFTVRLKLDGVTVFSTNLTIDPGEKNSLTAATAAALSIIDWNAGSEITVDVVDAADGTASGLIVTIIAGPAPLTDTESPSVPTGLSATADGPNAMDIVWDAASDNVAVTGYTLQRATNSGFTTGLTTFTLGNVTSYADSGLTPLTQYFYRVKSRDAASNMSVYSVADSDTTGAPVPKNLALASNGGTIANSSSNGANYPAAAAINGIRHPNALHDAGGTWLPLGWSSPEWLEATFVSTKNISEISVIFMRDSSVDTTNPTLSDTGASFIATAFNIQYWDGDSWEAVPGTTVSGNDKIWRQFTGLSINTTKIRWNFVTPGVSGTVVVCEVEALGI